ncbi:MAG: alpha/beta hydrolase [Proteobacteria bacterium]|nr:alpha/beta hydrolase [Pseudomonadota bacterium]MBU1711676.1 alpha/beta hydrolase [Pseudomonadota bacterium]
MHEGNAKNIGYVAGRWPLDPEKPTLVFIHGSGGSSALWEKQVDELKAHVNTIALDLPGHGRSSGPGMDTVAGYSAAVADFIETVEIPEPVPCGLSIGGAIVLQLILEHKERFKAAILVNTGARLRVMPLILETIKKDYEKYLSTIPVFAASEKTDPRKLASLMADTAKCNPETAFGDFKACDRFDVIDKLSAIITPVLILTAEDDMLTPPKFGVYMKEKIRKASMVNIKDAGHLSPLEQPEAFNRAITDFLKQEKLIL